MLREIGVTLKLRRVEAAEFQRLAFQREFVTKGAAGGEAIQIGASQYSPFGHFNDQVHSQSPRDQGGIRDPQIDEWATQQRSELDPRKRKEIRRKIWDKVLDLVFYLTEPKGYETAAIRPWLRHYRVQLVVHQLPLHT